MTVFFILSAVLTCGLAVLCCAPEASLETGAWAVTQLLFSVWPDRLVEIPRVVDTVEEESWRRWNVRHADVGVIKARPIPTMAMEDPTCTLSSSLDVSQPILLKGFLNHSGQEENAVLGRWTLDWLAESPRGDVRVPFASDARISAMNGGTVPDREWPIREIVTSVRSGSPAKTGSEKLFRRFPQLVEELPTELLGTLLGGKHHFSHRRIGTTLTVPIFLSRGTDHLEAPTTNASSAEDTRTDFHCEPISNVAIQLVGRKRWTLAAPSQSRALRPRVAPDGRAYVFANLAPDDQGAFDKVQRYTGIMETGDALYIPTWWWHRVDYVKEETSFTVSLFHVRLGQLLTLNPLYTVVLLPNLLKELVGWKTQ